MFWTHWVYPKSLEIGGLKLGVMRIGNVSQFMDWFVTFKEVLA
jgi:hypothetical protein